MQFERGNLSEEVWNFYETMKANLKENTLQIIMKKPFFSDGVASYLHDGKGNYKIYITPGHLTDYIFSHELLHVYIKANGLLPNLISFGENISDTSRYIAMLFSDAIEHKWIIKEQRRRRITGESEYVDKFIDNLKNQTYIETGKASEDFLLIKYLFAFMNDYPEHIGRYSEIISEKYPFSIACVYELLKEKPENDAISPYYLRRYIIKEINKLIDFFTKDDINCDSLKEEIVVKPVFREAQRNVLAEALLGISGKSGIYYFYTIADFQRCCPDFKGNIQSLNHGRSMLSIKTIGQVLDEIKLPHYIDDRNGTWARHN